MKKVYSHKHLGLFSRPFLTVTENGFYYKEKRYTHADIKTLRLTGGGGQPVRMGIKLNDGRLILVNAAALELNGAKAKTGFLSGTNEIFEELKDYFEQPDTQHTP